AAPARGEPLSRRRAGDEAGGAGVHGRGGAIGARDHGGDRHEPRARCAVFPTDLHAAANDAVSNLPLSRFECGSRLGRGGAYRLRSAHLAGAGRYRRAGSDDAAPGRAGVRQGRMDCGAANTWRPGLQHRRHAGPADWRRLSLDAASGAEHQRAVPPVLSILLRSGLRCPYRAPARRHACRRRRCGPLGPGECARIFRRLWRLSPWQGLEGLPRSRPPPNLIGMRQKLVIAAKILVALAFAVIAIHVLFGEFSALSAEAVAEGLAHIGWGAAGLMLLATLTAYAAVATYDAFALRYAGKTLLLRRSMVSSTSSYAISNMLGFPVFTGNAVRFWFFESWGLGARETALAAIVTMVVCNHALAIIAGATFLAAPDFLTERTGLPPEWNMTIGAGLLLA